MAALLFIVCTLVTVFCTHKSLSAIESGEEEMVIKTNFSYRLGPGDTPGIARALAMYGAKHKAVLWMAAQLADMGLLKNYDDRRMEIYCLVANELNSTIVDKTIHQNGGLYSVDIESRGSLADFVKAEIKDAQLEKKELEFSLQEEMEPIISAAIAPGQELSRAYRYIRNKQWRKAIIYLDQLEKKYPYWSDLFFAKGVGFEGMHEIEQAISAYSKACERGHQKGCGKYNALAAED